MKKIERLVLAYCDYAQNFVNYQKENDTTFKVDENILQEFRTLWERYQLIAQKIEDANWFTSVDKLEKQSEKTRSQLRDLERVNNIGGYTYGIHSHMYMESVEEAFKERHYIRIPDVKYFLAKEYQMKGLIPDRVTVINEFIKLSYPKITLKYEE